MVYVCFVKVFSEVVVVSCMTFKTFRLEIKIVLNWKICEYFAKPFKFNSIIFQTLELYFSGM